MAHLISNYRMQKSKALRKPIWNLPFGEKEGNISPKSLTLKNISVYLYLSQHVLVRSRSNRNFDCVPVSGFT